jgi:hypothetical protein
MPQPPYIFGILFLLFINFFFLFSLSDDRVSGPSVRIFLGGLPNVMILHLEFLICGMKNGLIKLWKPEDSDAHVS